MCTRQIGNGQTFSKQNSFSLLSILEGPETTSTFPTTSVIFPLFLVPNGWKSLLSRTMAEATKRYAVVTGGNKGIGFGVCKQLAANGINVILTARDERRGLEAVEKLKDFGLSGNLIFHRLDVTDSDSIASLANFIKTQFGKLDILVNNAGIFGADVVDVDAFIAVASDVEKSKNADWSKILTETYDLVEACVKTNYYGAKRVSAALIPLLRLSDSPKIVNVSSSMGKLENIPNEWAKEVLRDAENPTEEKIDDVLDQFLKDFKECSCETKGWPSSGSAYIVSKAALNAYTRVLAKKCPSFCINALCPGFVKTDLTYSTGRLSVDEGAESVVRLALLPNGSPSGLFFYRSEESTF